MRGMEAVIHGRGKPQRHISTGPIDLGLLVAAEQIPQLVWEALDLQDFAILHCSGRPDDRIARTDHQIRISIDRARTVLEPADEAVMQAAEPCFASVAQVQIAEAAPNADGYVADQRMLEVGEAAA